MVERKEEVLEGNGGEYEVKLRWGHSYEGPSVVTGVPMYISMMYVEFVPVYMNKPPDRPQPGGSG